MTCIPAPTGKRRIFPEPIKEVTGMIKWYLSLLSLLFLLGLIDAPSFAASPVAKGITLNPSMRPWRFVGVNPDSWFNPN